MPRPTASHVAPPAVSNTGAGHRLSADERRVEVIEAAVKAFASGGLHGTSTEDVARLAGVSQPYLFRLFGTKRELFLAAVDRSMTRIAETFEDAARHPAPEAQAVGYDPVLMAMGHRYQELLKDQTLLRMQLHAFAASDDPEVRRFVRAHFSALVNRVAALSGVPVEALRAFFAEGMLLNVAAALDLTEADVAWQRMCEGAGPSTT
jgi:AcrR family transcriptional regulator